MYIDLFFVLTSGLMLFFGILYILGYFEREQKDPKPTKKYGISIIVPVWNEAKTIAGTLDALVKMQKKCAGPFEVVVVDNNSTDNCPKIVQQYAKKYRFIRLEFEKKKQGKSYAFNTGAKLAKYELIACVDADSYPEPDVLNYIEGYFDDKEVGAVTTKMVVKNPKTFVERFQDVEYIFSNFLLSSFDALASVYVAKGPLSVYRRKLFLDIGGFYPATITPAEDMEVTFRIRKAGYIIRSSKEAKVYTSVMPTWKSLFWQRIRWNRGSMVNFYLHRDMLLNPKYGFFGVITMPIVTVTMLMLLAVIYYLANYFYNTVYFIGKKIFWYAYYGQMPNLSYYLEYGFDNPNFVLPVLFLLVSVMILVWAIVYLFGFKESKERLRFKRFIMLLLLPVVYFPAQVVFWLSAIYIQITQGSSKWR